MSWYNRIVKIFAVLTIIVLSFWLFTTFVLAQEDFGGTTGGLPIELDNPLGPNTTITSLIQKILEFLVLLGAPVATLMIIIGAYQMLFAGGSPEKFETGKKTILYTVIGYIIILLALGLASVIKDILGVSGGS